jgi:hypothetical protein
VTRLLQQPKDAEFEVIYKEHRYQPFWHVVRNAHYVYDRTSRYSVPMSGPEVRSVTIEGMRYKADGGSIVLTGVYHCTEEEHQELCVGASPLKWPGRASAWPGVEARSAPRAAAAAAQSFWATAFPLPISACADSSSRMLVSCSSGLTC